MFLINVQPHNKVEFTTEEILRLKLMKVITPFFLLKKMCIRFKEFLESD